MRDCPKCGSYVPEGKLLCPVCGRLTVGLTTTIKDKTISERKQTHARISDGLREVNRDAPSKKTRDRPYAGGTYEQHKSHDPNSKDYYKPKNASSFDQTNVNYRLLCAAAYFGIFFVVPLIALPNSREAKFHANQGLVLFLFNLVFGIFVSAVSNVFGDLLEIVTVIYPILMVYGASNAFRGNMTELPVIGKLRLIKEDTDFDSWR